MRIAAQAITAQTETAATLASINATLADVKTRLSGVEKLPKQVQ